MRVSSTTSEAGHNRKEGLDPPPSIGRKGVDYSPPRKTAQSHPGEISQDDRKCPLSPSVTHHGPDQKARKIERPPTPRPTKQEQPVHRNTRQHYRPPHCLINGEAYPSVSRKTSQIRVFTIEEEKIPSKVVVEKSGSQREPEFPIDTRLFPPEDENTLPSETNHLNRGFEDTRSHFDPSDDQRADSSSGEEEVVIPHPLLDDLHPDIIDVVVPPTPPTPPIPLDILIPVHDLLQS